MDLSFVNDLLATTSTKDFTESFNGTMSLLSILLLILTLYTDKKFSSASIGILVLCLGKGLESIAFPHLLKIASTDALLNIFAWYGGWISLHIVCLALLVKFHRFFQLRPTDVCYLLAWYYVIAILVEAIDFIERATLNIGFCATFYQLSSLILSASIVPLVTIVFLRDYYQRRQLQLQEL